MDPVIIYISGITTNIPSRKDHKCCVKHNKSSQLLRDDELVNLYTGLVYKKDPLRHKIIYITYKWLDYTFTISIKYRYVNE